jgi:hypothetical protein
MPAPIDALLREAVRNAFCASRQGPTMCIEQLTQGSLVFLGQCRCIFRQVVIRKRELS